MSNLVGQETLDDRRVEYLLLKRLNEKLIAASKLIGGSDPQSVAFILDAVQHNREVWNAFALDVTHPNNSLTSSTKKLVANLAVFVNSLSGTIVDRVSANDLEFLVSINSIIMEELNAEPC